MTCSRDAAAATTSTDENNTSSLRANALADLRDSISTKEPALSFEGAAGLRERPKRFFSTRRRHLLMDQFDDNCMDILSDLGFEDDQIISFGAGNVSLGQVIPSSQYMSLANTSQY